MNTQSQHHDRPRQAVILAGGRGTRLLPLTAATPKPMIPFHGRPFLEYLIEQVREQGFERVLLLLGYLPESVMEHFGDGSRFGVSISYSVTHVDNDTGTRLRLAKDLIEPEFLLLYCDNYWPMDFAALEAAWRASGAPAQVVVYENEDGWTRDNLRVADGLVAVYDKSRATPDLKGVDIGYFLLKREVLDLIPEEDVNFERAVYPTLVAQGRLGAFCSRHRYYSVGDFRRLPLTEAFLARRPAVVLDRDGVLNIKPPRACYVTKPEEFLWAEGAIEAVRLLCDAGWLVLVVSNQAGIARGVMTAAGLEAVHARMRADLAAAGAGLDQIYVCPHGWDEGCGCRKPKPGMLFAAQRDHSLDLTRTPFIGDDERDMQAGQAAGCPTILVTGTRRLLDVVREDLLPANAP
ncbi:MAG: HAD-IIIA family hydrolase [Proteobacteria bacterium]|nr:HAD-IIIA family hydrolase [Pseudomonadota bacterium]MBU1596130.1 HAD-IIIA family hydrolase [Pseudomonadota bacterium]